MYCQRISNCDYENDVNIGKKIWVPLYYDEWRVMWCYQQRLLDVQMKYDVIVNECWQKVYVISSMFFDAPSSVIGNEGTWDARRCCYTRTLAESKTMAVDIHLILCYV